MNPGAFEATSPTRALNQKEHVSCVFDVPKRAPARAVSP